MPHAFQEFFGVWILRTHVYNALLLANPNELIRHIPNSLAASGDYAGARPEVKPSFCISSAVMIVAYTAFVHVSAQCASHHFGGGICQHFCWSVDAENLGIGNEGPRHTQELTLRCREDVVPMVHGSAAEVANNRFGETKRSQYGFNAS
jgi:hypothetical protein